MKIDDSVKWKEAFWNNLPQYMQIIKLELESYGYETVKVGNSIQKLPFSIPKGLKSKEIQSEGSLPVISQSKEYIVGYSEREDLAVNQMLPLVVFGDHSKTIKYVDRPFVIGADGVKLLKPIKKFNAKYFFYFLHGVITDTKNYGRHYKLLREGKIPLLEDLETQVSIVNFIEDLESKQLQPKEYFNTEIEQKITLIHKNQVRGIQLFTELTHQLDLVAQLRQSFLREAMEGKLTADWREANPELIQGENSVSMLLEKIQAEKERLVKEKKIKKAKRLPLISEDEIPFELPEGWVWCRLGNSGVLKRGKSKHRPRNDERLFKNGNYPFIQTGDVARSKSNGYIVNSINGYYNEFGLAQSEMQSAGTLCITIAANIAECGFLGFDACTPDSIVCFSSANKTTEKYVFYYLIDAREEIEKYAPATAQKNINLGILNSLIIPLPPISEQKAIILKLDKLMSFCDDLEASIKESQEQNELLLQQVLREALEPSNKSI